MAWSRSGDKPLSRPMMFSALTHISVYRHQWIKPRQHVDKSPNPVIAFDVSWNCEQDRSSRKIPLGSLKNSFSQQWCWLLFHVDLFSCTGWLDHPNLVFTWDVSGDCEQDCEQIESGNPTYVHVNADLPNVGVDNLSFHYIFSVAKESRGKP